MLNRYLKSGVMLSLAVLLGCAAGPRLAELDSPGPPPADPAAVNHLLAAKRAERSGKYGRAVAEWEAAIHIDNTSAYLHLSLAKAHAHLGQFERAEKHALVAARQDSTDSATHSFLASLYRRRSDYPKAIEHLEKVVVLGGDEESAWQLVHLYSGMGRRDDAARVMVSMSAWGSKSWRVQSQWVRMAKRINLPDAAETILRNHTSQNPSEEGVWLALCDLLDSQQRTDELEITLRAALGNITESRELARRLAWVLLSQERWEEATEIMVDVDVSSDEEFQERQVWIDLLIRKELYDLALAEAGRLLVHRPDEASTHVLYWRALVELGRIDEALVTLGRIAELSGDMEAWNFLGKALLHGERYQEAEAALRRAIAQNPDDQHMQITLASSLQGQKRWDEALTIYSALLQRDSTNARLWTMMGNAQDRIGQTEEAVLSYQRCLQLEPDNAHAMNNLGFLWARQGIRLEEAHKLISRAVELYPRNGAFLDSMGWVLYKLGRYKAAEPFLVDALRFEPNSVEIMDHIGDLYSAMGRRSDAREYWQRALQTEPTNTFIQQKLETQTVNTPR